jgi:FixJ family two-component response regulator
MKMSQENCKVFVIDDDRSVRRSISLLLISAGYKVDTFASAEVFLNLEEYTGTGCIILDIFMDGRSGLELQEDLVKKFENLPIIYITGQGSIPMSVRALKKGAVNFLQKPVDDRILLQAIEEALNVSRQLFSEKQEENHIRLLVNSFTPREYMVFRLLITGLLNKQIAAELKITEHTVKLHRGKITEKLGVKSVAEMVKLAQRINL